MKLKPGFSYVDGWGQTHKVMGPTKHYPDWVWTADGGWYDRDTGRMIRMKPIATWGQHYCPTQDSIYDLKKEAEGEQA